MIQNVFLLPSSFKRDEPSFARRTLVVRGSSSGILIRMCGCPVGCGAVIIEFGSLADDAEGTDGAHSDVHDKKNAVDDQRHILPVLLRLETHPKTKHKTQNDVSIQPNGTSCKIC